MDKPNVLLVCVDHWGGRLFGRLGHPSILTPSLDALMASGITFTNAYSTSPVCVPARRDLYTGTVPRTHGVRTQPNETPMPSGIPSMPQVFRNAGYQAYGVGKLMIYPGRDRMGFDDILINEEGRHMYGVGADDYEMFLTEQGYPGQEYTHGSGNDYVTRAWHLPEYTHPTTWTARELSRFIVRRDPTRPAFWYLSFHAPHPPLTPPAPYIDLYRDVEIDEPFIGDWARECAQWRYDLDPTALASTRMSYRSDAVLRARRAFYAACTHVDNQLRTVIGTLGEEGVLDQTVILFTADHGDMLGNHLMYGKSVFYEDSAKIPMVLLPTQAQTEEMGSDVIDDRLVTLCDVMPTLMELCGIPVPDHADGVSMLSGERRDYLYGELGEGLRATRMVRDARFKLVYYAVGDRTQLFDLEVDPDELHDLAGAAGYGDVIARLKEVLISHLYGSDLDWMDGNRLVGLPEPQGPLPQKPDRTLRSQFGWRFR